MAQRLKRWESPRREGRNDKGRGGSARQRQRRKQFQMLRQRLKDQSKENNQGGSGNATPSFLTGNNAAPRILAQAKGAGSLSIRLPR